MFLKVNRMLFSKKYQGDGSPFKKQIDFDIVEKGIYLLTIISDGNQITKKLIIN